MEKVYAIPVLETAYHLQLSTHQKLYGIFQNQRLINRNQGPKNVCQEFK